jgi:hypothetical protein
VVVGDDGRRDPRGVGMDDGVVVVVDPVKEEVVGHRRFVVRRRSIVHGDILDQAVQCPVSMRYYVEDTDLASVDPGEVDLDIVGRELDEPCCCLHLTR